MRNAGNGTANILVIEQDRTTQLITGWGLSIAFHGCLMLAVLTAMPKLTLTLDKEPFHWDVALVEAPAPASTQSAPVPSDEKPAPPKPVQVKPQPARPPEPAPQIVTRQVQPQETPQPTRREVDPLQREIQPVQREIETVQRDIQPVQQEVQPRAEAERPVHQQVEPAREVVTMQTAKAESQEIKTAETAREETVRAEIAREIPPAVEHQVAQAVPAPVETREAPTPAANQPVAEPRLTPEVTARAPVVESPPTVPIVEKPAPVESTPMAASTEPAPVPPSPVVPETIEPAPLPPAPATAESPSPAPQERAPVIARALAPRPAKKADYGWLAESLHRRIVEVRQYPSAARVNGWEGKVVLRVQIRQDGHLDSVSVVKSSGHETLDDAAMEAVRRACPLHMKHELASPMVVVQVPINYSLNR